MRFRVKNIFRISIIVISSFSCAFSLKAQIDSSYLKFGRIPNHDTTINFADGSKMIVVIKNDLQTISNYYSSGKLASLDIYSKKDFISYTFDCKGILFSSNTIKGKNEVYTYYGITGQPISIIKSRRKKYYKATILYQNPNTTDEDWDKLSRLRDCIRMGQ